MSDKAKTDLEAVSQAFRRCLSETEWAEFQRFLDTLPSPSEKLKALVKKDEAWPK